MKIRLSRAIYLSTDTPLGSYLLSALLNYEWANGDMSRYLSGEWQLWASASLNLRH